VGDNAKSIYEFGPFRLDPAEHTLVREGKPIALAPKVFDILTLLVKKNGHLFGKEELMQAVWPDSFVEEGNLTRNISTLRTALGENPDEHQYIETVPKRGYRFVGFVTELTDALEAGKGTSNLTEKAESLQISRPHQPVGVTRQSWYRASAAPRVFGLALAALAVTAASYAFFFRKTSDARQPEIKSLAVLPLKSLATGGDDQYLGLGLADTIITRVSQINNLTVRPSSAVSKYANQQINSLDAANELQVDSVLDGTIQHAKDHVRINFNLLRTKDGASLWSQTFDLNPKDPFKMQDEVSQQVATRLRLKLRPQGGAAHKVNPEAYDYYLRAKFHSGLQSPKDSAIAIELLERAVAIDPSFAAAYATLSQEYRDRSVALKSADKDWEEKATVAVSKALALDPDLAEAHVSRAVLLWTHNNHFPHEIAIQELRKALELNPNLDEAHHQLGNIYNHIGLLDKGQDEIQKAVAINPANFGARFRVGVNLLYQSNYEQALAAFREATKFNPQQIWGYQTAWALFQIGRKDEAAAIVEESLMKYPEDEGGSLTSFEAILAASNGNRSKAEAKIKRAEASNEDYSHFHHTAYAIASAYALLRKPELALKWLQMAADDGFPCYPFFEKDPNLNTLRQDPRFIAFMTQLKQRWEHYQATLLGRPKT
jgi:DNA-binding winged helix-turn-helix (wHTH) protein/TolB-like protein/Tfp pilus assembly protein PilF